MNLKRSSSLLAIAALAALATTSSAQNPYAGLWVGNAKIEYVSDANPPVADLGFDLGLEGKLVEQTFIATNATWSYNTGTDQGIAWPEVGFDDSSWSTGDAPLGYGDTNPAPSTVISFGGVATDKYPTAYFRNTFTLPATSQFSFVRFRVRYDDGVVVYLNGATILRDNLSSVYSYGTYALSSRDGTNETAYVEVTVPGSTLTGTNVVAAEVHQFSPGSDDLRFQMEVVGTLANVSGGTLIPVQSGAWHYDDSGTDRGTGWTAIAYGEPGWSLNGVAPLGYGNGTNVDITTLNAGPLTNKNPTTYFRKTFTIASLADQSHLDVLLRRDDGAVVYINGVEVVRSNMPGGPIAYGTAPIAVIGAGDESTYNVFRVSGSSLVVGTNVVAVEVHQSSNEIGLSNSGSPTFTPAAFEMRLILHVHSNGTVRLLKDVTQMWKDGTYASATGGPPGSVQVATTGRFVLVTDPNILPNFKGVGTRDGQLIGRRVSAIGYDLATNELVMAGSVTPSGLVSVTNNLGANHRTNPFLHKFHPDHDNLDASYNPLPPGQEEAYAIGRAITLDFDTRYPADPREAVSSAPPAWGQDLLGGIYSETLTGLHKNPLQVTGWFELQRVSRVDRLNDGN